MQDNNNITWDVVDVYFMDRYCDTLSDGVTMEWLHIPRHSAVLSALLGAI